jgi:DNA-binding LacI/PurR family transcriptional regulator
LKHYSDSAVIKPGGWAKQEPLGSALLAMAQKLGPGRKLPTVRQICSRFKVSTSTLDPVLRSLETRGSIVRKHGSGIFVSEHIRQKTIGVVFGGDIFSPNFSPFWSLLLQAVRDQASGCAMRPRAYLDIARAESALEAHAQLTEDLEAGRLDGLLLLAPQHDRDEAGQLRAYGVPLVVLGGDEPDWRVTFDWTAFARRAVRELNRAGCRRVALAGHGTADLCMELKAGLRRPGPVPPLDDWSYERWSRVIPGAGTHENCAYRMVQRLLAERGGAALPEAVVSMEDTMTRGILAALREAGFRPGRDIRVVTAENSGSPVLEPYGRDLTTIPFAPGALIRAALGMLKGLMDGNTPPSNPVRIGPVDETEGRAAHPVKIAD